MQIIPVACGFDNFAYLLICGTTRLAAVIDPTEAYPVWREVEKAGAKLRRILCTHHHRDHTAGIEDLLAEQPELGGCGYRGDRDRIPGFTQPLADGDEVQVGHLRGRVLHTPGHTTGSLCYQFGEALFTGDTLFGAGCGRLFEGTAGELHRSLSTILAGQPPETRLYFGHDYTLLNLLFARSVEPVNPAIASRLAELEAKGKNGDGYTSTLFTERLTNPFLRCHCEGIRRNFPSAAPSATDAEIFALLRQRRDSFQP